MTFSSLKVIKYPVIKPAEKQESLEMEDNMNTIPLVIIGIIALGTFIFQ